MRRVLAFLAVAVWPIRLAAQTPADSLVPRTFAVDFRVSLPASWRPLPAALQSAVMAQMRTTVGQVRDSVLRAAYARGEPVMLLYELAPDNPDYSANFNAAPSPGAQLGSFAAGTLEQVQAALAPQCGQLQAVLAQAKGRLLACDRALLDTAAGRTIAITRVVRTGRQGFVTAWIAQYPDQDVVYTLTLTAPQSAEARMAPLYRQVWRSMAFAAPGGRP